MTDTKVKLSESLGGIVSETVAADGKRTFFGRIIEGNKQGSSGYYSREMLMEQGATTFPAKTHMHADHQSWEQYFEFPAGSVKDLIGYISDTPEYLEAEAAGPGEPEGLYAHFTVSSEWATFIHEFKDVIGLSIKTGAASIPWTNPATGEETELITQMENSALTTVDFVTHPGANGRILSLVESESYKLPPGFKLITNRPAAEAAGNRKKENKFMELTEETAKALSGQLAVAIPLMTAEADARAVQAAADKKALEEAGEVDVNQLISESSEMLAESGLNKVARERVLTMTKAGVPLAEAIKGEVAYLASQGVKLGEAVKPAANSEEDGTGSVPDFFTEVAAAVAKTAGNKVSEADVNVATSIWGKAPKGAAA